eukprot:scaffold83639_cov70-Cyclotella_meneghiniana.AAC.1
MQWEFYFPDTSVGVGVDVGATYIIIPQFYEALLSERFEIRPATNHYLAPPKPWRPPPYANLSPLNTAIATSDALSTGHRVSVIDCAKIASTITAGAIHKK